MTARLLTGKEPAAAIKEDVAGRVSALADQGKRVGLATVLVGDDPASHVYVAAKHKAAAGVGIYTYDHQLDADADPDEAAALIRNLNSDPNVDGILVQLPLPEQLDADMLIDMIDPARDADGLHPFNLGLTVLERETVTPATPQGILELLRFYDIGTSGRLAVVIGRSRLVGRPLAVMLSSKAANATVVQAHTGTNDLPELAATADLLIVAAGTAGMVDANWVQEGATVIDVGISRVDGKLAGDVVLEQVVEKAGAVTPVPGGVGPMTIACLLRNTVSLAERRQAESA
jgi:methylenetetrahydrofolate dehydrogenase (NADP+)/methenyltetrahydrofolate cyclohydrolase